MIIETIFSPGDNVWVVSKGTTPFFGTVGQVRVVITDSPGRLGEERFDNYKPQKDYEESYMLVETGINSGYTYTLGKNIFATRPECEDAIKKNKLSSGG